MFTIYLAGGMCKFGKEHFDKSDKWRRKCGRTLIAKGYGRKVRVVNPNDYFNFKDYPPEYDSQREVMEFDLNNVRNANLIIVNFNDVYSLGTMAEIAIAYERKIPIIGLNEKEETLHPWQIEMTNRIFTDLDKLLKYVEYYYLN